jgi:hypothetical protein
MMGGEVFVPIYDALGPVGYGIFCAALIACLVVLVAYFERDPR